MYKSYYDKIQREIEAMGFKVIDKDFEKPWGAYLVISEDQILDFLNNYFKTLTINEFNIYEKLSPKILIINPFAKISWQYHIRRSEIWQILKGDVKIILSNDDIQREPVLYKEGDQIRINKNERHRLIGTESFGVVAEIWQHTDSIPSDENDIIRLKDDYNRS